MTWEYEVLTALWGNGMETQSLKLELNERGKQGWELVGMTRDETPDDDDMEEEVLFVFKRLVPVPAAASEVPSES